MTEKCPSCGQETITIVYLTPNLEEYEVCDGCGWEETDKNPEED